MSVGRGNVLGLSGSMCERETSRFKGLYWHEKAKAKGGTAQSQQLMYVESQNLGGHDDTVVSDTAVPSQLKGAGFDSR